MFKNKKSNFLRNLIKIKDKIHLFLQNEKPTQSIIALKGYKVKLEKYYDLRCIFYFFYIVKFFQINFYV
jgi:hypothetical protein